MFQRNRDRKFLIGALAASSFLTAMLLGAGEQLTAAGDSVGLSDVAVIPGGDAGPRTIRAAELYSDGLVRCVLLLGYTDGMMRRDTYASRWQAAWLIERGVPVSALSYDSTARNTWEEAKAVRAFLAGKGMKSAIVITDPPFIRRSRLAYGKVFEGSDSRIRIHAADSRWWRAEKWWSTKAGTQSVFHENAKLQFYHLRSLAD